MPANHSQEYRLPSNTISLRGSQLHEPVERSAHFSAVLDRSDALVKLIPARLPLHLSPLSSSLREIFKENLHNQALFYVSILFVYISDVIPLLPVSPLKILHPTPSPAVNFLGSKALTWTPR